MFCVAARYPWGYGVTRTLPAFLAGKAGELAVAEGDGGASGCGHGSRFGRPLGLPISGPGLTMGVGRLSTEVNMVVEATGREMDGAYLRLGVC
jgi:hypothetical protein